MKASKKGQEEIVGFMLIVVMLIVIGVFMLFMMKPKISEDKDPQLQNLLYSIIGTSVGGNTIGERVDECARGGECEALTGNLTDIIDIALSKSGNVIGRSIRGASFEIAGGMEYSYVLGNSTSRSIAAVSPTKSSLLRIKFYY